MLYHLGARNFECKECGNKFFQMEHLKRHMQSIHNTIIESKPATDNASTKSSSAKKTTSVTLPTPKQEILIPDKAESEEMVIKEVDTLKNQTIEETPETKTIQNDELMSMNTDEDLLGPKSFNIISKSTYKCSTCEFTTPRLFNLNQHNIREHFKSANFFKEKLFDIIDQDDQIDSEDETSSDFSATTTFGNVHDLNEISNGIDSNSSNPCYLCSFCSYFRTSTKILLKKHLKSSHSSQMIPPIVLNNDPVLTDPNTKFKCDTCQSFLSNLNEFVRHMNDVHKTQVRFNRKKTRFISVLKVIIPTKIGPNSRSNSFE
jgi:hypothetical protein